MTATALLLLVPLAAAEPRQPALDLPPDTVAALVRDLSAADGEKKRAACAALVAAGPRAKAAVPALVALIGRPDVHNYQVAEVLGAIGPDAKTAVPALFKLIPDDRWPGYEVDHVALALAKIDRAPIEATRVLLLARVRCTPTYLPGSQVLHQFPEQVVPHLVALCADKEPEIRRLAALTIGTLNDQHTRVRTPTLYERAGAGAKGIESALEKLLADEDAQVRFQAADSACRVAPQLADKAIAAVIAHAVGSNQPQHAHHIFQMAPDRAANALVPLFDHPKDTVRSWAIQSVAPLPAREPVEAALANGKTTRTRQAAAMALGARGPTGAKSIPVLKTALADPEFDVRFAAAGALVLIGLGDRNTDPTPLPVLVEGLQRNDQLVQLQAIANLLLTGSAAKSVLPELRKLLADHKPAVRLETALALIHIDPKNAADAVPALVEALKSDPDQSAVRAAKAAGELGPIAKDTVPELVKLLSAKNLSLRLEAASAVARIDSAQVPQATEALVALLKEPKNRAFRFRALTALQQIGPGAKAALPVLTELLKDNGPFHVDVAAAMIAIDAEGAKAAFEWMRTVLAKPSHDDWDDVLERVSDLGANAKPLVPDLVKMLDADEFYHRRCAIGALATIGSDATEALPKLKKIAESDPRADLRKLAGVAMKKIEAK
jgi:HEAT repeat protein